MQRPLARSRRHALGLGPRFQLGKERLVAGTGRIRENAGRGELEPVAYLTASSYHRAHPFPNWDPASPAARAVRNSGLALDELRLDIQDIA